MQSSTIFFLLCAAFAAGFLLCLAVCDFGCVFWDRIAGSIRIKLKRNCDKAMDAISDDTQIVLKHYMQPAYHYGEFVYLVRNVRVFDFLLTKHLKKIKDGVNTHGSCDLQYCVQDNLKNGKGFVIIMNGEEYVAIPPPVHVDPNSFVQ